MTTNLAALLEPRRICVNGIEPGMTMTDAFMSGLESVRGSAQTGASTAATEMPPMRADGGYDLGPEMDAMVKRMCAMGRVGNIWEVADVVGFLASDDARWVHGQNFGVDGGLNL